MRNPAPLRDPALQSFLDEVVVPILVERFLRERAVATLGCGEEDRTVSSIDDSETLAAGSPPG